MNEEKCALGMTGWRKSHFEPFACHSERSKESPPLAQDKLREKSNLKFFFALSLLVHTLIFISMERFLPFEEKPVIDAIPIQFIQEHQKDVAGDPAKNDASTEPEEIKVPAHPILSQVEPSIEPEKEIVKELVEIKAPEPELQVQVKTPEPLVSAPVSDRKLPVEPVQEKVEEEVEDEPLIESSPYLEKNRPNQQTILKDETPELNYTVEPQPVINSSGTEKTTKTVSVSPNPAKIDDRDNGVADRVLQIDIENAGDSGKSDEIFLFMAMVRKKIEKAKSYPGFAKRRGYEGTVTIKFKILPDGSVTDLELDKPAQHMILNRAARQAIQKAAPFKPRPKSLENQEVKLKIPIAFKLK